MSFGLILPTYPMTGLEPTRRATRGPCPGGDVTMRLRMTLWMVAMTIFGIVEVSNALVWCAAKDRRTGEAREGASAKLRTACRPTEIELDLGALGLRGPAGDAGAPGDTGTPGAPGMGGSPGVSALEIVSMQGNVVISGLANSSATATCPGMKKVLGGGFTIDNIGGGTLSSLVVLSNSPLGGGTGWSVTALGQFSDDWAARAWAVCALVAP